MKFVLDASVAIKWVLTKPNSLQAIRLRDNWRAGVDELLAPDFFAAECGHALFRAGRKRLISLPQSSVLLTAELLDAPTL